ISMTGRVCGRLDLLRARPIMALKDLLVYVDPMEDSFLRLRLGVDLAARHESRLTALFVTEWSRAQSGRPKAAQLGLTSAQGTRNLEQTIEDSMQAGRTDCEQRWKRWRASAALRPSCVVSTASPPLSFLSTRATPTSAFSAATSRRVPLPSNTRSPSTS